MTSPNFDRGSLVQVDGLLAAVVGVYGDPGVPEEHLALWFGTPQVRRRSQGGDGDATPEVWLVPVDVVEAAALPDVKH
jgi:hypothetical protein